MSDQDRNTRLNFNAWWQAPSKATDMDDSRAVSMVELFCDLVFVAYVASVTHGLTEAPGLDRIVLFVLMFSIGYIIWFNSALYHDLHGNNDFRTRITTFLQMVSVGFLSAFTHDPLHHTYTGYAISLAAVIFILAHLWRQTGIADPDHARYSRPYSTLFYITSLVCVATIFLDPHHRLIYMGIIICFLLSPILVTSLFYRHQISQEETGHRHISHAFLERSNLFIIIVLGEFIVGGLNGFGGHDITGHSIFTFCFGFLIAFGLWFNHFEFVGNIRPRTFSTGYGLWLMSHYMETMVIAMLGGLAYHSYANINIIYYAIPLIIYFVAILLHFIIEPKIANPNITLEVSFTTYCIIASILILIIINFIPSTIIRITLLIIAIYLPIVFGISHWIMNSRSQSRN